MTNLEIARRRLFNQHIGRAVFTRPEQALDWLVAAQSQDYAGAKWALGLRLRGGTDGLIEQAFADGAILRTHLLRPTWHFVRPADIRWLLGLTAARVHAANAFMYRRLELDGDLFRRSNAVLERALRDGQQRTRDELREALEQAGVESRGELRMSYFLMHAELDGILCSGARRGKQFSYALLEERVPPARAQTREEAMAGLAERYFTSRGPATVQDFAKWSGLTVSEARSGLGSARSGLCEEQIEGQSYWMPASLPDESEPAPAAQLLSIFDEYISSYKDRRAMAGEQASAMLSGLGNALGYVIVLDGQIVGTWKRAFKKDSVRVETLFFNVLSEAEEQAVRQAAQRYADYLRLELVLD